VINPPAAPKLRIGLIGYGSIARTHHQVLDDRDDVKVVAIATRSAVALPGAAPELHTDHRAMLERDDIDLVVVCTPSGQHCTQALDGVRAGKHVVTEKPLTLDIDAGQEVVNEAQEAGLLLSVISQRRFEPVNRQIKRLVDSGRLGRAVLGEVLVRWYREQAYYDAADWRGTTSADGGVLMNQAIHAIDLLRWFMGEVAHVQGTVTTLTHTIEAADTASAALRFHSGALGAITATTSAKPGAPAELNLFFDRGFVSLHDDRVARWEFEIPRPTGEGTTGSGAGDPTGITSLGHRRQWEDIMQSLRDGTEPGVTGQDALRSAALVLAIHESSRTGAAVPLTG